MMFPHIFNDANGHSVLGETELMQPNRFGGTGAGSALQDTSFWEISISEPGDSYDFQPTDTNRFQAILSGQVDLTVSNGDVIRLARGDMLFQTDITGQGHTVKYVGLEPCMTLSMAMPGRFK